ncbi:MAG: hypothetical protein EBT86_00060 [Actinobacteria bacterium]|nr:hypothetical protein [Actinomycetota bacterium]
MSGCGTFKCAKRLYEGHGTSSYRPSNPEVAAENQARLARIQAERDAQDRMWGGGSGGESFQQSQPTPERKMPTIVEPQEKFTKSDTYVAKPVWPRAK